MIDLIPVYGKSIAASTPEAAIAAAGKDGWTQAEPRFPFPDSTWLERGEQRAVLMLSEAGYMLMVVRTTEREQQK